MQPCASSLLTSFSPHRTLFHPGTNPFPTPLSLYPPHSGSPLEYRRDQILFICMEITSALSVFQATLEGEPHW